MINPLGFTAIFGTILGLKVRCSRCGHIQDKKKYGLLVKVCEECGSELFRRPDAGGAFDVYDHEGPESRSEDDD